MIGPTGGCAERGGARAGLVIEHGVAGDGDDEAADERVEADGDAPVRMIVEARRISGRGPG